MPALRLEPARPGSSSSGAILDHGLPKGYPGLLQRPCDIGRTTVLKGPGPLRNHEDNGKTPTPRNRLQQGRRTMIQTRLTSPKVKRVARLVGKA